MGSDILENIMVDESGNHHEMVQVHELGFVKLLDVMGDDQEVENAARISYGEGTPPVCRAAREGHQPVVEHLVAQGVMATY